MNKNLLCAALLGGLSLIPVAHTPDFDDRWYITGSAGFDIQDNDRGTRNTPMGTLGVGKFLNPNWSLDGIYLNRLSDWLFTLARYENYQAGESETKWIVR